MNGRKSKIPFRKTPACPSSSTLLHFRKEKLSPEISHLVESHLEACDFCRAELMLLVHHRRPVNEEKPPEIPMNLRILAESILGSL